jgi:hypothetical protein
MSRVNEKAEELKKLREELGVIELEVIGNYTIADAIREGCQVTEQEHGWGDGARACAFTAGVVAARSRGLI